ncbi:hypothetical protein [Nonomuraea typhae]|uniref:hypothetical protein n=1 Tax=Nonomuraea typhae TaxID=2603600 RepID=UPI0012FA10C7|nr:hypothetical protein [Nonomuraea typhae]
MRFLRRLWTRIRRGPVPESAVPHACTAEEPPNPIMYTQRVLQPPPMVCTHSQSEGLHVTDEALTLVTPAEGDALHFEVSVWVTWCAQPATPQNDDEALLRTEIATLRSRVRREVHDLVRAAARTIPAHRPELAEEEIQRALNGRYTRAVHDCDRVIVKVAARTWVTLTEDVRERQRKLAYLIMDEHARLQLTKARVERLGAERDVWMDFLIASDQSWRGRFAVLLAEHGTNAAEVILTMQQARKGELEHFVSVLQMVDNAQKAANVNIFDLVTGSDKVIREAFERLGVELSPAGAMPWEEQG